jgi:hypothetical protein
MVFGFRQIVLMETYEASERPAQIHIQPRLRNRRGNRVLQIHNVSDAVTCLCAFGGDGETL